MPSIFGAVPSDDGRWFVVWVLACGLGVGDWRGGCCRWLFGGFAFYHGCFYVIGFLAFGGTNLVLVGVLVAILVCCAFCAGNLTCIGVLGRQIRQGKGVLFV